MLRWRVWGAVMRALSEAGACAPATAGRSKDLLATSIYRAVRASLRHSGELGMGSSREPP